MINKRWTLGVAGCLALASAGGQTLDRSKRPATPEPTAYRFPDVHVAKLSNGIPVYILEKHSTPVVAMRIVFPLSQFGDPIGKEGLFTAMSAMLLEGTTHHSAAEIADSAAMLGTSINPGGFTTLASEFLPCLHLMADVLLHPAFPATGWDAVYARLPQSVGRLQQLPGLLFAAEAFGTDKPAGRKPTAQSVISLTREDVIANYHRLLQPNNIAIVITGDITAAAVMPALESEFGGVHETATPASPAAQADPLPNSFGETTIYLADRPDTTALIYTGIRIPPHAAPAFAAADIAETILADNSAGRLVVTLRGAHHYAYSVGSFYSWDLDANDRGTFVTATQVPTEKVDSSLVAWSRTLSAFTSIAPPSAQELVAARSARIAGMSVRLETVDSLANRVADLVQNHLPVDFLNTYVTGVETARAGAVESAAQQYFDPNHAIIVVVGNRRILEPKLRAIGLGPVVVIDLQGRPVK